MPRSVRRRCGLYGLRPASFEVLRHHHSDHILGIPGAGPHEGDGQFIAGAGAIRDTSRVADLTIAFDARCPDQPEGVSSTCNRTGACGVWRLSLLKARVRGNRWCGGRHGSLLGPERRGVIIKELPFSGGRRRVSPVDRPMTPFAPCVFARDLMGACGTLQGNRLRLRFCGRAGRRPRPSDASRDGAPHRRRFSRRSTWYTNVTVRAMLGSRLETLSTK
jgi:hypothetical protein